MPLDFKPVVSSSYDEATGISIPAPRTLPTTLRDGQEGIEYQYAFRCAGERIGAVGIFGSEVLSIEAQERVWIYTLDMGKDSVLKSLFDLKEDIGNSDDKFSFLRDVARGLVNVFAARTDNQEAQRNIAFTSFDALAGRGVVVPSDVVPLEGGRLILAEVYVPAHPA